MPSCANMSDVLVYQIDLSEVADCNHLADRGPELYSVVADVSQLSRQVPHKPPKFEDNIGTHIIWTYGSGGRSSIRIKLRYINHPTSIFFWQ